MSDRPASRSEPASASMRRRRTTGLALCLWIGGTSVAQVHAADAYPTRPITIIAPFVAGGPSDIFARTVANGLSKSLGQAVTVENRTGAGGNIATSQFLAAKPDGYTLLIGASYLVVSPYLYKNITYDPLKDFVPIGPPVESHLVYVTRPGGPSLNEMIATAKSTGVPIKLASPGAGTLSHLGGVALGLAAGAPITHVPYRGVSPGLTDIMAGHVDLMIDGISSSLPLIKAGKVKGLAVPADARDPALPDLATTIELGHANSQVLAWNAVFALPGTPSEVVDKLNAAVVQVMADPEVAADLQGRGLWPTSLSRSSFKERMASETRHWKAVITTANITAD